MPISLDMGLPETRSSEDAPDSGFTYQLAHNGWDTAAEDGGGEVSADSPYPWAAPLPGPSLFASPEIAAFPAAHVDVGSLVDVPAFQTPAQTDFPIFHAALNVASSANGGGPAMTMIAGDPVAPGANGLAELVNSADISSGPITEVGVGSGGATAAQVQQALDESGLSVNGSGIKVGVISDSFNDLGGAAADEADGALPSASNIQVLEDLSSGGTDEGRAMMQIVHDIAPGASLAFYTAFNSEQDFANGILALAAAGCKVICDDVSYFDEPFFQNGIVAQAIQTVEAEGVTYVSAAGNDASNGYQAAWTPISGTFDGRTLTDAESFGGSLVQTISINTEGTGYDVPLLLEWNQAYGAATSDLEILVFQNGSLVGTATNRTSGEPNNPWIEYDFTATGTYQIAVVNLSGPNPGLIKEITEGDGLPATISGANAGTVFGHAMTPGAIAAGAVSSARTPAFGFTPTSESFSSSGAGTELLFANNGTALSSPDMLSPVAVSGVDDIATTVSGGLSDFYGTSAASASLAGVAALLLSENPNLTPAQVEQVMEETALPISNSAVSGSGLVQVDAAVAAVTSPSLVDDVSLTVPLGGSGVITSSLLRFDDAGSSHAQEIYTVITTPVYGTLLKNGSATSTFTQADIDNGLIGYQENGSTATTDSFVFKVTDAAGNTTTVQLFDIQMSTTIESFGATTLVQVGNHYFLDSHTTGTGPEVMFGGAPLTVGEFAWTPIGTEQTSTGYEIALKYAAIGQYTVWNTDSSGNVTYDPSGNLSGTSEALEAYETSFHQDLNGDGVIGIPATTTVIESSGSTNLVQVGTNYFLDSNSTGTGPEVMFGGAPLTAGEFPWTPIGAEQTSTGYEIALKYAAIGQYTVWNTDANGNV
ncbi:cadherin-like domain-containing protein, partial [Bradyrhizobium sp.]|uniref:cadherin-like domain-containing protein n=1 Tax=Bradyrhizobium sp. TaxID=376 RepID=UPI002D7EB3F9